MREDNKDLKDKFRVPENLTISTKKELLKFQHMRSESLRSLRNHLILDLSQNKKESEAITKSIGYSFKKLCCNDITI
jgi:hypothetical protein